MAALQPSPASPCASAVAELAVFMLPVDVMTFLPNFFFGALVMWIGQDIMKASAWAERGRIHCRLCCVMNIVCSVLPAGVMAAATPLQPRPGRLPLPIICPFRPFSAGLAVHRRQARERSGVRAAVGHAAGGHGAGPGGGHCGRHCGRGGALCLLVSLRRSRACTVAAGGQQR